ncbi:L-2-hydroxyglutarate oxidase, partial [Oscillatoriales cyanobacterium LEGE 11467]
MYDFAIIGGGIVGLSTAMAIGGRDPHARILVLEKESCPAAHQTGRNSGVIHSGIYYKPGSFKAKFCRQGNRSMVEFCQQHDIPHEICGKVIVATERAELPALDRLYQRGLENGLDIARLSPEQVREIEPHVRCLGGIRVDSTGIVDYRRVCQKYAELCSERGVELRLKTKLESIHSTPEGRVLETNNGTFTARMTVNCAGLHSDRVARSSGVDPGARIVPFRGEYYELKPEKRHWVKNLIYPVPNPSFPFLGVHFTRSIDRSVHAGPNAVLSFKREGYRKTDFDWQDFREIVTYPGFWKLSARYFDVGVQEMIRSFRKAAFVRSLQRLIPEIQADDLAPIPPG